MKLTTVKAYIHAGGVTLYDSAGRSTGYSLHARTPAVPKCDPRRRRLHSDPDFDVRCSMFDVRCSNSKPLNSLAIAWPVTNA